MNSSVAGMHVYKVANQKCNAILKNILTLASLFSYYSMSGMCYPSISRVDKRLYRDKSTNLSAIKARAGQCISDMQYLLLNTMPHISATKHPMDGNHAPS